MDICSTATAPGRLLEVFGLFVSPSGLDSRLRSGQLLGFKL